MPLPDKYADEPKVEVPVERISAWRHAEDAAKRWRAHADALKQGLIDEFGESHAFTVNDEKLVTYRFVNNYAVASLVADYPDLTAHYMVEKAQVVLDLEAFRAQHPEIAEKYHTRSFKYVGE